MGDDLSKQPVPGVKDTDLAATVSQLPSLPTTSAEDAERFAREVRALAEKRAQASWPNESTSDLAVFVLTPYPREAGKRFMGTPVLDLLATDVPILGRLFFLTRDASNGQSIDFPTPDPATILDWLNDNGFGNSTIVLLYRAKKTLVARRKGTSSDAVYDSIRDKMPEATTGELLQALAHFHRVKLLIPSLCPPGVWERGRSSDYVPGRFPEKSIQMELRDALNFWFRGVIKAEVEDTTDIGRIDVRLLRSIGGPLFYWAIIELKVIKSRHNASKGKKPSSVSKAENIQAIRDGILQAHAYRANRQAEEGLLEVFDMRQDKVEDLFTDLMVKRTLSDSSPEPTYSLRVLFGDPKHARLAGWV
jgi:hypothetical protein